jgi:tetratricopeptide (TPR) repeat protein
MARPLTFNDLNSSCLSHEEISMFLNGELGFWQARTAEKHLARCDECREKLADIIRAGAAPLDSEERAHVAAHSQLVIADQLRAIESLAQEKFPPASDTLLDKIRELIAPFFPLRPAWIAVVLVAAIGLGQHPLRRLAASHYVESSLALMQDAYAVHKEDFRPHGFPSGMFSEHHSATPPEKLQAIEDKLQRALFWDKNSRAAKRAQALHCYFEHNYDRAESMLRDLLHEDDKDFAAWNDLGILAALREDTTAALAAFEKALALKPDDKDARHNRDLLKRAFEKSPLEGG